MIVTWANSQGGAAFILGLGPAAWYRFNQGITVATGVSQWNDASGNGRNFLQGTAGAQPAKQGDGSILFDGVDDFLQTAGFTLNQPCTFYLLGKQVTWTVAKQIADGGAAGGHASLDTITVTPQVALQAGGSAAANADWAVGVYAPISWIFNGAGSLIQVGNNAPTTGNPGAANPGGITLAAFQNGAVNFSNIQAKEMIAYPAAHDAATRARVNAYLSTL